MARPQPPPKMTFDEFPDRESRLEPRHGFVDGPMQAMAQANGSEGIHRHPDASA